MSKPRPARDRTASWSAYNDALRQRGSLLIWLDKEMAWHAPHEGRPGRPPVFSDAALQFCLSIEVPFKLPLIRVALMNRFHALGTAEIVRVGRRRWGKG